MFFSTYHPLVGLTSRPLCLFTLSVSHLRSTSCTWHSIEQDLRPREGRGAGQDFPSAFPPPHRAPLISPHKHTWKPAVVGPSGPGLSCVDVSTCCGLCWTSLELRVPCTIWVGVGSEARVWVQFILTLHTDLRILPPPSSLGLGRESKSRLHPPPPDLRHKWKVWKEKVSCPRSGSGNSQDCALTSAPQVPPYARQDPKSPEPWVGGGGSQTPRSLPKEKM